MAHLIRVKATPGGRFTRICVWCRERAPFTAPSCLRCQAVGCLECLRQWRTVECPTLGCQGELRAPDTDRPGRLTEAQELTLIMLLVLAGLGALLLLVATALWLDQRELWVVDTLGLAGLLLILPALCGFTPRVLSRTPRR